MNPPQGNGPASRFRVRALLPLLAFAALTGCAHYEHDIVQPQDLAQHVGTKEVVTLRVEPLEYRLRTVENRLVMFIDNPGADPVKLRGDDSVVVDPHGQSHPLRSQTIAPGSSIKLIFPPIRPHFERTGPSIGIGVGTVYGRNSPRNRFGYTDFDDEPRYYAVYDDDAIYWNWEGEGEVRLSLVYERGKDRFTHDFVFRRKKM